MKEDLRMEHKIKTSKYYYTFGPNEPALKVKSGDKIVVDTVDARGYDSKGNTIPNEMKQRSEETEYHQANPLIGPFYVEDANLGDTLVIQIERIALNRNTAWSLIQPNFGSFTEEVPGKRLLLNNPLDEHFFNWILDLKNEVAVLNLERSKLTRIEIPLNPFIGSIGVAPRYGRIETSLTPGEYGGNMNCVETKEGTKICLPVFVKGAYLAFGDVHAAQGDGETCGSALETTAEVTIKIDVIKGKKIEWPRLEDDEFIMVAGSSRSLMEAFKIANLELLNWLVFDYGFDRLEALQILTQVGTSRIGNVVDTNYTIVGKFPKKYLP